MCTALLAQTAVMTVVCFSCALYLLRGSLDPGHEAWRMGAIWAFAAGWSSYWFGVRRPLRGLMIWLRLEWRLVRLKRALARIQAVKGVP